MQSNILVAYDGTPQGDNAFHAALHLAESLKAKLWVVAVIEISNNVNNDPETDPKFVDTKENYESTFGRMLSQAEGLNVACQCSVRTGKPVNELVDQILESEIKYLVIGCKHRSVSLTRWLFGSTLDDLVHRAPCPVVIVH